MKEKLNIVVLDGYSINPGDLSWKDINSLGNCIIYDRTSLDEIVSRCKNTDIILTNKVPLSADVLNQLPKLKFICVMATGYNIVDVKTAKQLNIVVSNIPAYCINSVAQMVFAHLFNLTLNIGKHVDSVRQGDWVNSKDFCFWNGNLIEIANLTIGVIGFGNIGRVVAKIANSFSMNVIAYKPSISKDIPDYVSMVDIKTILQKSDVISLNCPLNAETEKLINKKNISLMKSSVYIINTSRGGLVDEEALAEALNTNKIAGAGLDVLSTEPPKADNPLVTAKNCYITPHIAWATVAARKRLMAQIVDNIKNYINNSPINVVS